MESELRLVGSEEPFEEPDISARPSLREPDGLPVEMPLEAAVDGGVRSHKGEL